MFDQAVLSLPTKRGKELCQWLVVKNRYVVMMLMSSLEVLRNEKQEPLHF